MNEEAFLKKMLPNMINRPDDKWMYDNHYLMNFATRQSVDTNLIVKDARTKLDNWDINFLNTHLPHTIVN